VLLAIPSVVIGFLTISRCCSATSSRTRSWSTRAHPAMAELAKHFHGAAAMALHALLHAAVLAGAGRRGHGLVLHVHGAGALPAAIDRARQAHLHVLENKYYMDWFNETCWRRRARCWAGLWKGGDQA
jgi:NADH-quinone oxidoreductase subunit L